MDIAVHVPALQCLRLLSGETVGFIGIWQRNTIRLTINHAFALTPIISTSIIVGIWTKLCFSCSFHPAAKINSIKILSPSSGTYFKKRNDFSCEGLYSVEFQASKLIGLSSDGWVHTEHHRVQGVLWPISSVCSGLQLWLYNVNYRLARWLDSLATVGYWTPPSTKNSPINIFDVYSGLQLLCRRLEAWAIR